MGWFKKLSNLLSGKKTYLIALIAGALVIYTAITGQDIPDFVWQLLAVLGLGAVRAAIKKSGGSGQ